MIAALKFELNFEIGTSIHPYHLSQAPLSTSDLEVGPHDALDDHDAAQDGEGDAHVEDHDGGLARLRRRRRVLPRRRVLVLQDGAVLPFRA